MISAEKRAEVVAEAMTWLGTKYHHQAAVKGAGADCARFPIAVYAACGVIEPISPQYLRDWHIRSRDELYLAWIERLGVQIEESEVLPGDYVVWRFGNTFSHGGIITEYPMVIHAYIGIGVTLDDINAHEELRVRERRFYTVRD
jgi:NlpC/P60 family putative phage cell wall peptidase